MKRLLVSLVCAILVIGIALAENGVQNAGNPPTSAVAPNSATAPSSSPLPSVPFRIVQPVENARLPALASTFVCGSAPTGGKLLINGMPVVIHPGGGFLAMVPLTPGQFTIRAELQLGDTSSILIRTVWVAEPERPAPADPVTIESVTPRQDQEVETGDEVTVVCKGSPGLNAWFTVKGVRKDWPMVETGPGSGIYQGVYRVDEKDRLKRSTIEVTLGNNEKQTSSAQAQGVLSRFPDNLPTMAETISPDAVLRAGPAIAVGDRAGYLLFPPAGTVLRITGKNGDEYRVRLSKTKTAWVSASQVKLLPEGTPPARAVAGNVTVSAAEGSAIVRLPLGRKIPFTVAPDAEGRRIDITLFGAYSNTDLIAHAVSGPIRQIQWFQDDEETYRLRISTLRDSWWGYDVRYQGNALVLELRTPPPLPAAGSALAGLVIAVDAGHSPDTGAVGVTGYLEKDANLAIALKLEEKLVAQGARVLMIRRGNEGVPLSERPKIAWQNRADLLVSVHNNSLGYGGNPFLKRGYGVYYFTPMSRELAGAIHAAYGESIGAGSGFKLRDDGLYYDNLAVVRPPQMPSVLTESAYMIVPEEEALLKTDEFRAACADAIVNGLERYARRMRPAAGEAAR